MENMLLSLLVIFTIFFQSDGAKWEYDGDLGTKHWHRLFPDGCAGRQQSPIDIKTTRTQYDPKLNDFAIWFDPPKHGSEFHVINNGHTMQVNVIGEFHVANGGLPSVYSTAQFHFHWGHANHHGSEHLIDSRASPLELHIVNFDSQTYKHIGEAMVQPMGLAVLGVMYEVGEEDNEALEPIIQAMDHVKDPEDDNTKNLPAQPIRNFLPSDTSKYFRYNGSLTTPGCFESVLWTVFHEPQYISHRQLSAFRRLLQKKRHKKHGNHHNRDRRSATKDDKMVKEVLEEVGIKDDPMEKLELDAALHNTNNMDAVPSETPELGEPPKKFYVQGGNNPDTKNMMKNVNQSSSVEKEQKYKHVETENEKKLEEIITELEHQIERLEIVNNFRPVQPLYGRIVYRSFNDLSPAAAPANPIHKGGRSDPENHSSRVSTSWAVLCVLLLSTLLSLV